MSDTFYTSCAEVLSLCQTQKDDLATLLDPDAGFAPRLRQICHDQLIDLEESGESSPEELDALRMEYNTWGLLQALLPARKTEPDPSPSARTLLAQNPYTPTATLAQATMEASRTLSELVVVREWLHETAPPPPHGDASTGYWRFTKHRVMQALRTGNDGKGIDSVVKQMDPDAVVRSEGESNLAADDASYDKALAQTLYAYVRAGRLEEAVELCREAHQPWRAASIRGSLLFQWKALSVGARDEDEPAPEDPNAWSGNRRRNLWKSTCTRAALDPRLTDAERALYAALAPSSQTASTLRAACRTWEDLLWAQISVMCEERQTAALARLGGGFWENGLDAVQKDPVASALEDTDDEEESWREEVVETLQDIANASIEDGLPADNPFHMSQLHIILDRTDDLLNDFAIRLQEGMYDPSSLEYPTMTRFFAHLCLFLQMIDIPVSPLATQIILEAYLRVLEAAGQRDLIAMYAGALGDNAVERYALFLTSLELSADITERRLALTRARDHGLDMERVAVVTAERTVDRAFELLPSAAKGNLPSVLSAMQGPPTDAETLLLRSIEWTTFLDGTADYALEQANVILRYFLARGRVRVARLLLDMLPAELASIDEPEDRVTEYLHYRQFFVIWDTLDRVVECQALEAPQMTRDTRTAWLKDYQGLVEQARDQIVKLLTTDWLIPGGENTGGDRRLRELTRVRQLYIPELILRLHVLLLSSRTKIPANTKHALELANVVADSRYRLYEDFTGPNGRRLSEYIGAVRHAVLAGLEHGGSDPFSVVLA
ncbi:nuclear pore protein 84/107 [Auriscalpium vulgare]|uniref:Nuclear pore protein 84/107 n=1 Tax=Auriscalpium vulgare TaxID=40419 RepID=A0ACB8RXY1_9AGAM|nr:nuclear pore protein 84/107 [Auriscalpium vulgare]